MGYTSHAIAHTTVAVSDTLISSGLITKVYELIGEDNEQNWDNYVSSPNTGFAAHYVWIMCNSR